MTQYEDVLNHLMFHKALLNDHEGGERITRYLNMVGEIEQGHYLAVRDPMEKAIAAAFELVLEAQFNPWEIDLAAFTKVYLEKVRDDGVVNFVTAGKLVAMAWSILKMQSDQVVAKAEPPAPQEENFFSDWDVGLDVYDSTQGFDYTQAVLRGRVPLTEAIRREGKRAVTLVELMQAFDEARLEAEQQLQIAALREKNRAKVGEGFERKVHGEDLNEDLALAWSRLLQHNGSPVAFEDLVGRDPWDRVTVFVAVLFLAKMEKVLLVQRDFPYGDIFVQRVSQDAPIKTAAAPEASRSEVAA